MPSPNGQNTLPGGDVTQEEIARVQASLTGLEQAPSSRQQLGSFANWKQVQDQLGQPFNNERIPLSKLKLMRRDAMIGFGLHFIKTPLVRAPWFMKSADVEVAAFMDGALRPVMPSLIIQCLQKLDFGFQAIAKRFQFAVPHATYISPETGEEVPAWSASPGGIQPLILKPFVALPPEGVDPIWDEATGEFNGINYKPPAGGAPAGTGAKSKGSGGSEGQVEIDLYHSLWVTNEKDSVFGNVFGYPRLGYVYPYWWSYWFRWAVADRAFERKGDPATVVRYPEGEIDLGNGQTMNNNEYALMIGERLRAGATVALPSVPYLGLDDKPSTVPEWNIDFLVDKTTIDKNDEMFSYIDVQKLRALFIPEQALIEGGGGTSSRNVAKEMYEGLVEAQSQLMSEIVEVVNRFIIPHLLVVNFPDRVNQGITCTMETRGFKAKDMELLLQITQLIGQQDADLLGIDIREYLREHDMPLVPQQEYEKRLAAKAAAAALEGPGQVPPTNGAAGVTPTPGRPPQTEANQNGASATGFAYVPAIESIELSSSGAEFIAGLPPTMHYTDPTVRALARVLWSELRSYYKSQYESFIDYLNEYEGELRLSDDEMPESIELAPSDFIRDFARRVVDGWPGHTSSLDNLIRRATATMKKIAKRIGFLTKKEIEGDVDLDDEQIETWVQSHLGDVISKTNSTTRQELQDFTANFISEGNLDPGELSKAIQAHFSDFPDWKADRWARTEVRDAVNAGVLLQGRAEGLSVAQAVDARYGPTDGDCELRDGQFYTIDQAFRETEHPNGTLGWRLISDPVNVSRVSEIPEAIEGALSHYDEDTNTIYLANGIEPEVEREYLLALGEGLKA